MLHPSVTLLPLALGRAQAGDVVAPPAGKRRRSQALGRTCEGKGQAVESGHEMEVRWKWAEDCEERCSEDWGRGVFPAQDAEGQETSRTRSRRTVGRQGGREGMCVPVPVRVCAFTCACAPTCVHTCVHVCVWGSHHPRTGEAAR